MSVSRSAFALVSAMGRVYIGIDRENSGEIGVIDSTRSIFCRSYAAEPDVLIAELSRDETIAEADSLILSVPTSWESTTTLTSSGAS